jgi:acetylornithine/N-succinyldiaminopimelate aminotransferase
MLADGFLETVRSRSTYLRGRVDDIAARHPRSIVEVRGAGLMLWLKPGGANTDVAASLRDIGLITVPAADNVVRLLPPLTISEAEIDQACDMLAEACRAKAA